MIIKETETLVQLQNQRMFHLMCAFIHITLWMC